MQVTDAVDWSNHAWRNAARVADSNEGHSITVRKYASFDTSPQIGDSEIVLTAKSKDTGKQLAKAVCIVDRNNVVLSLKVIALRRTRQF